MRSLTGHLRVTAAAAVLVVALIPPAEASAQINSFQVATAAQLDPAGTTVSLPVTINCGQGDFVLTEFRLAQSRGTRSVQGFVGGEVTCTGADQAFVITFRTITPFKRGSAVFSGCLALFDEEGTPILGDVIGPQRIRIGESFSQVKFREALTGRTGCFE